MKPAEKLDVKLQAEVLQLGQSMSTTVRGSSRLLGQRQTRPEESGAEVERVLNLVRGSPARKLFGIRQGYVDGEDAVRLKTIAIIAWQMLGEANSVHANDIAKAVGDNKGVPCEQMLLVRDCLARMVCDGLLVVLPNSGDFLDCRLVLPRKTLSYMAGGSKSKADFDPQKLDMARLRRAGEQNGKDESGRIKMPTAKQLFWKVRKEVEGLDNEIKVLASRISLHATRAELLRAGGEDHALGQMVVVLVGSSGSGKSYLASKMAENCGLTYVEYDCTSLTASGFVGSDVDEPYRLLVNAAGGDAAKAAGGILLLDEMDKKASRQQGLDVGRQAVQMELLGRLQATAPFVVGGKRSFDSRPFLFDGRQTGYVLAGVFSGLDEVIEKRAGRRGIGFASEPGSRQHIRIGDCLKELGFLDELVNRISCVIRLPDPTFDSVMHAVAGTIVEGYNNILCSRGISLMPSESAARAIAGYAIESRAFYRGAKAVLATIVEELLFAPPHVGTAFINKDTARRAIERLSSGVVQPGDATHSVGGSEPCPDGDLDGTPETETVGG